MQKNVASQKIQLFAFDTTTGAPKTGDAANITAYVSKDHGAVTVLADTSAAEMDATNAKGIYVFDVAQTETNADELTFSAKSSTSNISITPRFISTTPPNFSAASIDSSGRVDVIKLASQTVTASAGVTFPSSVASPTNITAGTITTVTNLTNAPTSGDLTATMKTSVTTAATAATPALSAAGVTAIWAEVMTGSTTAVQAMRGFLAVLLGKASGLATATAVYRNVADNKDVITATVDESGNRTAVTRDLT